jgi:hypothetical protein
MVARGNEQHGAHAPEFLDSRNRRRSLNPQLAPSFTRPGLVQLRAAVVREHGGARRAQRHWCVHRSYPRLPPGLPGLAMRQSSSPRATWGARRQFLRTPLYASLSARLHAAVTLPALSPRVAPRLHPPCRPTPDALAAVDAPASPALQLVHNRRIRVRAPPITRSPPAPAPTFGMNAECRTFAHALVCRPLPVQLSKHPAGASRGSLHCPSRAVFNEMRSDTR